MLFFDDVPGILVIAFAQVWERSLFWYEGNIMIRYALSVFLSVIAAVTGAFGLDLPGNIALQFGFSVQMVPDADDASQALGLVVTPEQIYSANAYNRSLVITGTITNYSELPREGVSMRLAVTSYIETGVSRGSASVTPSSIPPGGTASFTANISLDNDRPRLARYTVSAHGPTGYVQGQVVSAPVSSDSVIVDSAGTVYYLVPGVSY